MRLLEPAVAAAVCEAASSDRYGAYLRNTLVELCAINTTPSPDRAIMAARERELFDWIERELRDLLGSGATIERPPIDPAVASGPGHPHVPDRGSKKQLEAVVADQPYAGRGNLLAIVPGGRTEVGPAVILQTGVDVAAPWFGPRTAGTRVVGRGACGSRAQVALLLAQIKLLREIEEKRGARSPGGRVYQFVIDAEHGGNGSPWLVSDPRFAGVPVLMHASTDLAPHCAHCGEVWYRARLSVGGNAGIGAVELVPFVVQALEAEGRRLQAETNHPMFTAAHVQTNHGVLGGYGSSPATGCDHVAVEIVARSKANPERVGMKIVEFLDDAVADYVAVYGDKTREHDPATGRPKVDRHFAVRVIPTADAQHFRIDIYGKRGPMGAVTDCDGAITKAAYLLAALVRVARSFPGFQAFARLADEAGEHREVVLEGAQSFSPSHTAADVQTRMRAAARLGAEEYCRVRGCQYEDGMAELVFDRVHSEAWAGDPDVVPMQALRQAFAAAGEPWPELSAWRRRCDARIYHAKGHPVAIFGAGKLANAHSDDECIDVPDMQKALAISTLATWAMTQSS